MYNVRKLQLNEMDSNCEHKVALEEKTEDWWVWYQSNKRSAALAERQTGIYPYTVHNTFHWKKFM